ncbi:hypothetical protein BJ170DRAFT_585 [Xylariales sp. AK1849]|nr:hypothetical protein BJ170DRAFT_585 [Xylariales sp. AK1849]
MPLNARDLMSVDFGAATKPYTIPDTFLGARQPIKVIVIGFGVSGINVAHVLGQQIKSSNITLQIYEKNRELGGTWFENIYPGCACDIPAVNYQFSWHPKTDWTSYYASSQEILGYLNDVVSHYKLDSFVKLNHEVTGAWWDEEKGQWKVRIQPNDDAETAFFDYGEILINATGVLNNWKWPAIPGLDKFKNKVHTAAWDKSLDLTGKTVGVIGNGSSAVQIIPAIYEQVKHMKSFIRSSAWVTAGFASKFAGENGANIKFTEEQKKRFAKQPEEYLTYRKEVEREINQNFAMMIKGTTEQIKAEQYSRSDMQRKLKKSPELADKLIPTTFAVGCRRPTPGNGYLETISDDKCNVIFSSISEISEDGVITEDGATHKLDVLICATGFDVSFRPRFPVVGTNGLNLRDAFEDSPETYISVMAPDFPNYFMILGPFGPYGHGSVIPAVEVITKHIALVLRKLQTENIKSLMPKKTAVADFKRHREIFLKRTVWDGPCRSWFKLGPKGEAIMMWPGTRLHFFDVLLNPRWEDYDWKYKLGNRYSYWGNGFTTADAGQDGADPAWYIDTV